MRVLVITIIDPPLTVPLPVPIVIQVYLLTKKQTDTHKLGYLFCFPFLGIKQSRNYFTKSRYCLRMLIAV